MTVVVCIDNEKGLLFNNRRQSRDSELINDLICNLNGSSVIASDFSKMLFENHQNKVRIIPDTQFKELLLKGTDGVYFVENTDIALFQNDISQLIIYKWNRNYPADMYCTINLNEFTLQTEYDFAGSSHKKITKVVYVK